MMAHAPASRSETTYWRAQVRRSKNAATHGSRIVLSRTGRDRAKVLITSPRARGSAFACVTKWTRPARVAVWAAVSVRRALQRHNASEVSLLSGLWNDANIRLRCLPALRIELLSLFVRHRAGDDHVLAPLPVHRRRDPVLGR